MLKLLTAPLARNKLSILIFHQVMAKPDPFRGGDPTVSAFDAQMKLLRRYFNPISLAEGLRRLQSGDLPAHAVAVTFDDGYLDNLTLAAPVLERYQIPATFFVTTGFFQENMWNDRVIGLFEHKLGSELNLQPLLQQKSPSMQTLPQTGNVHVYSHAEALPYLQASIQYLKYLPPAERLELICELEAVNGIAAMPRKMMREEEIRALHAKGFEIGGHTKHHPILASLDAEAQKDQILINKQELETILNEPVTAFAYPNGKPGQDYNELSVATVKSLGFDYAVSTVKGVNVADTDPYQLHRFTPWDKHLGKFYLRMLHNQISGAT